jgi:hypothetical protein
MYVCIYVYKYTYVFSQLFFFFNPFPGHISRQKMGVSPFTLYFFFFRFFYPLPWPQNRLKMKASQLRQAATIAAGKKTWGKKQRPNSQKSVP